MLERDSGIHSNRIPSLDGLRAVSIAFVVIGHLYGTLQVPSSMQVLTRDILDLPNIGGLIGVRFFFVISGFLITNLLIQELDSRQRIRLGKFYFRRTFRIFPAFYSFLLVMVTMRSLGWVDFSTLDLNHAITYTTNYCIGCTWVLFHSWSLAVEEQFYLLWPVALQLIGRQKGPMIALAIILLCPLIRLYFLFAPSAIWPSVGYGFESVADALATGCLLAFIRPWLKQQAIYNQALETKFFLVAPFTILVLNSVAIHPSLVPQWLFLAVGIPVMNFLIAMLVDWFITYPSSELGKLLNSKPFVTVGILSYSIYLWQQPFLIPSGAYSFVRFPLDLILIATVAFLSYSLIERPFLRLRARLETRLFSSAH